MFTLCSDCWCRALCIWRRKYFVDCLLLAEGHSVLFGLVRTQNAGPSFPWVCLCWLHDWVWMTLNISLSAGECSGFLLPGLCLGTVRLGTVCSSLLESPTDGISRA